MSNTKTTDLTKANALVSGAETKLNDAMAELTTAGCGIRDAAAEISRIEQAIEAGDASISIDDLTKANSELKFYSLTQRAKARAAEAAQDSVREAKTAVVMAKLDAGDYDISKDALRTEAVELAKKHAAELAEHRAKCDAHNKGVRQLLSDLADTDAFNDSGTGNPASPLAWGHEDGRAHNPRWVSVREEVIPLAPDYRVGRVQKYTEWVQGHGDAAAEQYCPMF